MKISIDWLNDYLNLKIPIQRLIDTLTLKSVEVDYFYDFADCFKRIVVGEILEIKSHPRADRLQLVVVNIGDAGKRYSITKQKDVEVVCGGTNLIVGNKVVIALPGSKVRWHGEGELQILSETMIRGVKSMGMICASEEIGFMKSKEGEIMVLDHSLKVGQGLAGALNLERGVLDLDVLVHRGDLMSHRGVAREMAALFDIAFVDQSHELPKQTFKKQKMKVTVKALDSVPRYSALLISGVEVKPSPPWLQHRLLAVGLRPINNVVDITNYLMYDFGVPLHAFDASKITGEVMNIREAREGEKLVTLDGQEQSLRKGMLIIEDHEKLIDLAGIMGGQSSEISSETHTILLQAAVFDGRRIRQTSRQLNQRTEAVSRYEKGVDATQTIEVLGKAWKLIKEMIPSGELQEIIDILNQTVERKIIDFSEDDVKRITGMTVGSKETKNILQSLGCKIEIGGKTGWKVIPPSHRFDLTLKEDLVEEVARFIGYDALPEEYPLLTLDSFSRHKEGHLEVIQTMFVSAGFHEVVNLSFISPRELQSLGSHLENNLKIQNPLSHEQSIMRSSLLNGLLQNVARNERSVEGSVKLFETGRVFHSSENGTPVEEDRLTAVVAGKGNGFFVLKGMFEKLESNFQLSGVNRIHGKSEESWYTGETVQILRDDKKIATVGCVSSAVLREHDIKGSVCVLDIDLGVFLSVSNPVKSYRNLPRFPSVYLDLAIVLEKNVTWYQVEQTIHKHGGEFLGSVRLFDMYTGDQIKADKKSFAFHLEYRVDDRTLTMEEVEPHFVALQEVLQKNFSASIRKRDITL